MNALLGASALAVAVVAFGGGALTVATRHVDNHMAGSVVKLGLETGGHGSAIHIGDGYYVTAAHVTKDATGFILKTDQGNTTNAVEVLWENETYDVALIRVTDPTIMVQSANLECRTPEIGEAITLQGSPLAMEFITTWGHISGKPAKWGNYWANAVPVDGALGPGMSGGGAFDADGDLIGINVGMALASIGYGSTSIGINAIVPGATICDLLARG